MWVAILGVAGWTHQAQAQGPEICPDSFAVDGGFRIPICRNYALEETQLKVTRAVVAIHGAERRATETYAAVIAAAEEAGEDSNTLVVAPQFLNETDPGLPDDVLYWSGTAWRFGNRSVNGNPRLSSYAVLDAILIAIAEGGHFPNLATLVVAGHSAGGQFTQRFASASSAEIQISEDPGVPIRYVVMNPGSWLYLDPARWDPNSESFIPPDPQCCPGYDDYGYGLHANLNEYMRAVGPDEIRKRFGQRRLAYLLGDQDICRPDEQCTTPPGSPPPDGGCAALLQGSYRFERGSIFYEYVQYFYGPEIVTRHSLDIVPGVGHDGTAMFTSSQSLNAIFDYAPCSLR
jgi:hypothetical protein